MSWLDDMDIDCDVLIETEQRRGHYDDLTDKEIATEILAYIKFVQKDYLQMVRDITQKAMDGNKLTEKQRKVLVNTIVNIEEAW